MPTIQRQMKVYATLSASIPGTFVSEPVSRLSVNFGGIPGTRHFGLTKGAGSRESQYPRDETIFNRRQISAVFAEELSYGASALGITEQLRKMASKGDEYSDYEKPHLVLLAGLMGADIVLRGVEEPTKTIIAGTSVTFKSGAGLLSMGMNNPCKYPGEAVNKALGTKGMEARFPKAFYGRRGIVAIVEKEGDIAPGDTAIAHLRSDKGQAD